MLSFNLSENFLTGQEQRVFRDFLTQKKLDENIWEVFSLMFKAKTKNTNPLVLRAYNDSDLVGAAIIIKCKKTGRSLFKNRFMAANFNALNIPVHVWMRFGCCVDMMSNPGFVKYPDNSEEIIKAMAEFLHEKCLMTIINDYSSNRHLYKNSSIMPSLSHGLINCEDLDSPTDYTSQYKNINRKIKTFAKKGGEYSLVKNKLDTELMPALEKCFISTADKSVFYLPHQDLYLNSAKKTSGNNIREVYYFVAKLNGEIIGYQAAIKTGKHLKALHGAFDRSMKTTFHAYDILFAKMTEFAIENDIKSIDFGAVLNYTKQKMVNETIEMSYFIYSKFRIFQSIFKMFLKFTQIQGKEQLKFRQA